MADAIVIWEVRADVPFGDGTDITGYSVEATDGSIGKVDEATFSQRSGHLVVKTGPPLLGKRVVLPAGVIDRIDHDERIVTVDRSEDEVLSAPTLDEQRGIDEPYRAALSGYYTHAGDGTSYRETAARLRAEPFDERG